MLKAGSSSTENNNNNSDTIVAVATAAGQGGIGIVRLSGERSLAIAKTLCQLKKITPRQAIFCSFVKQNKNTESLTKPLIEIIDEGLVLYFSSPHSFTGEDVIELQAHGNPVLLDQLVKEALVLGARMAKPGEFSERAFLNNKIDLTQAESIADIISANSEAASRAAVNSLQGKFSAEINILINQLVQLRAYIEASMDFPEEEVDFLNDGKIVEQLNTLTQQLAVIFKQAQQGALITEGMSVVIIGKPNAGKSCLLNALSGKDSAIVTSVAGTTRDVLREHIQIDGLPLHIIDTAGLRETNDPIEQEGIRRAKIEIEKADRLLLIIDDNDESFKKLSQQDVLSRIWPSSLGEPLGHIPITLVFNKCDLSDQKARLDSEKSSVYLSALTGDGLDLLKQHLKQVIGYSASANHNEGNFSARRRHLTALTQAQSCIKTGLQQLAAQQSGELLAEELRLAQQALEEITGRFAPDDLLDKIFRDFCIGK